jgi:hypothetical protein
MREAMITDFMLDLFLAITMKENCERVLVLSGCQRF